MRSAWRENCPFTNRQCSETGETDLASPRRVERRALAQRARFQLLEVDELRAFHAGVLADLNQTR